MLTICALCVGLQNDSNFNKYGSTAVVYPVEVMPTARPSPKPQQEIFVPLSGFSNSNMNNPLLNKASSLSTSSLAGSLGALGSASSASRFSGLPTSSAARSQVASASISEKSLPLSTAGLNRSNNSPSNKNKDGKMGQLMNISSNSKPKELSALITLDVLRAHFHRPLNTVAQMLNISVTYLKTLCRKNNINKWPYRRIQSLEGQITALETALRNCTSDAGSSNYMSETEKKKVAEQIEAFKVTIQDIINNPSASLGMNSNSRLNTIGAVCLNFGCGYVQVPIQT
jgi:hypothetical protein